MNEIRYISDLSTNLQNRMRVVAEKERGKILKFTVQYEAFLSNQWCPIVRYDTAHGFAHRDVMHPNAPAEKQSINFTDYNQVFTYAIQDIKHSWKQYRARYEGEITNDSR